MINVIKMALFHNVILSWAAALVLAGLIYPINANADYLELEVKAHPTENTILNVSWLGRSGGTFKMRWRPKKDFQFWNWEKRNNITINDVGEGSGYTWYTGISEYRENPLICNTEYEVKVKLEDRGWRKATVSTSACGEVSGGYDSYGQLFIVGLFNQKNLTVANILQLKVQPGSLVVGSNPAGEVYGLDTSGNIVHAYWQAGAWHSETISVWGGGAAPGSLLATGVANTLFGVKNK